MYFTHTDTHISDSEKNSSIFNRLESRTMEQRRHTVAPSVLKEGIICRTNFTEARCFGVSMCMWTHTYSHTYNAIWILFSLFPCTALGHWGKPLYLTGHALFIFVLLIFICPQHTFYECLIREWMTECQALRQGLEINNQGPVPSFREHFVQTEIWPRQRD